MSKNVMQGVVTSDKTAKTRRVEIPRLVRDPRYGKYVRRRTICYVHDEKNESSLGDTVEIVESRPRSKTKRWELVRVISKGHSLDVAALREARRRRTQKEEAEESQEPQATEDSL